MSSAASGRTPSLWKPLYALEWLVFLQILVIVPPLFGLAPDLVYLHVGLGLVIVFLAHFNRARLSRRAVPGRIQRTVRATAALASVQFLLGIYAFLIDVLNWSLPGIDVVLLLHLVLALAILSQASATGMAYDMWEEREFERVEMPSAKS